MTGAFWASLPLWRDAMGAVLLCAALCSFLGVYIVLKRIVFVGLAVSQMSGLGIAAALLVASSGTGDPHAAPLVLSPTLWATAFAVGSAALFSFELGSRRISGESVIGLGYVAASAVTLVVLNSPAFAQEAHEISDVLYGNAVAVTPAELGALAAVAAAVLLFHAVFFKELFFVAFDRDTARAVGYPARTWNLLLHVSIGVAISAATRAIGMLPVFGLLVVPAAAALLVVDRMALVFALAMLFGVGSAGVGFYASWALSWPTGAAIVVVAAAILLVAALVARLPRRRRAPAG